MGEAGAMIKEVAATKERISEQMQESAKRGLIPGGAWSQTQMMAREGG